MVDRYTVRPYMVGESETFRVWDNRNKCFVLGPCKYAETAQTVADSWNKTNN